MEYGRHITLRLRQKAAILQVTFLNMWINSWTKMYQFRPKFHWNVFLGTQLNIFYHWFRSWLGADQATSHHLNQCWLIYWRIYASLGLNEIHVFHFLRNTASFRMQHDKASGAVVTTTATCLRRRSGTRASLQSRHKHYSDVVMSAMVSQITGVSIVCTPLCPGADQRQHQSSSSLAFVRGIHR